MTIEIAICLAILGAAIVLFAWDRIPADVIALGVMLAIIATGLLAPDKAFAGFSSDTVLMILGLLVMSAGLVQTGVVDMAGRAVFAVAGNRPRVFLPVVLISVAVLSAFMSNTAATAIFVPLVIGYARRTETSPSRYLLPLAFSSILTSSVTLVATSTNLVVSDMLARAGQPPIGMFEMAPVGLPIAIAGIIYVLLVATRMLGRGEAGSGSAEIGERTYQADVVVTADSPLIGQTLEKAELSGENSTIRTVKLIRGEETIRGERRLSEITLAAEDELLIEGARAELLKIKGIVGVEFKADVRLPVPDPARTEDAKAETTIVEGVVLPQSPMIGETLKTLQFKERYGLDVLAIHRAGRVPRTISSARLRMGDVLLLQGTAEAVKALEQGNLFNIFGGVPRERMDRRRAPVAIAIFVAVIAAVTLKLASLPVAALSGAFAMMLTRCITPEEAYRQVEWKALILIGSLISLGTAMDVTGAGKLLADQLVALVGSSPTALLTCFFILTVALTQPMSNQAAALVVLPIALQTAAAIGAEPRAFAMMVAVAASCSYLTPLEPSCLMVYGPGKYRFADFAKVGAPLTLIIYGISIWMVPRIWPLAAG